MLLPEHALRHFLPGATLPEARLIASEACHDLREETDAHCRQFGDDAFCAFLRIHSCICRRVQNSDSVSMLLLNAAFAWRCVHIAECLTQRRVGPEDLSLGWVDTIIEYVENPYSMTSCLFDFAASHIKDDLEGILFLVYERTKIVLSKNDFDYILLDITTCFTENTGNIPDPIDRLLFTLGRRFGVAQFTLQRWREQAWDNYLERIRLKEALSNR